MGDEPRDGFADVIGSAEDQNLDVLVQTITGLHSPPSSVDTGNSGLADQPGRDFPLGLVAVGAAALALATGAGLHRRLRAAVSPARGAS